MEAGSLAAPAAATNGNSGAPAHVKLGEHNYPVYPQKIGRLENRLGRWLNNLVSAQVAGDANGLVDMLGENVHNVLSVFIPRLMPLHEFRGYRTAEAMAAGDYDDEADTSPTVPEIREAFRVVLDVNDFDLFGHLGKVTNVLDLDYLKAFLTARVAKAMEQQLPSSGESPTGSSTTTPPTTSTDSGTTPPTSTESTD